ncbi:MAG: VCBS repeat-containing protein, partial [Burkholderiales bacterium]|nr:VCBS repeat-containing protein [Burkholderiales bacterium]
MNDRYYLRAGVVLFISTILGLYFIYGRDRVSASSYSTSSNVVSNQDHLPGNSLWNLVSRAFGKSTPTTPAWPLSLAGAGGSKAIQMGCSTPSFAAAPTSPEPVGPDAHYVGVGDINGDSHLDIVTTDNDSASLTILLGDGTGNFTATASTPFSVGTNPGDGTFTPASGSPVVSVGAPFHAVIGNFNADANADLAVANLIGDTVTIFLGDGSGGFSQFGSAIPAGTLTAFLASGDFNGDSNTDLAVVNRISNNLIVFLGNGNGGFSQAPGSPYTVGTAPMAVAAGDLNLDGKLDLAAANESDGNTNILLGNGDGTFTQSAIVTKGQLPTHLALADFNEDGKLDIGTSDAGDNTVTILLNTCNACTSITVNPTTIATGTVGTGYSETFTATGGTFPYSVMLTGTLPTGLSFTDPTLSGTPTQSGSFPITVTAMDNNGCPGSRNYTLVVNCQTITVDQATIPSGTAGTTYSQTFTQTGGIGTTTFSLTGILPTGITFSGATLSGTPTQTGSFPITVTATDSNGCTGNRGYTLVINCQNITVNPATIPAGIISTAYSQTFTQAGGIGTTTFALTGTLPTGLTFSGATLSGTPTQSGSFPVTVTATDSNGCTGNR